MKLTGVELRTIQIPLVTPFRTSFGTETVREALLVRAVTDEAEGWGECGAGTAPLYSAEYTHAAADVLTRHLVPALAGVADGLEAHQVAPALAEFKGHRMAKAALETAVLDVGLRARGVSFGQALGAVRDRVPCGVSVGITDTLPELLDTVGGYLGDGYRRIKLKIEPGWDIEPVRAVRERFGDIPLQVDANTAYSRADARHLAGLDPFGLLLLEQPLAEDDLLGHAELARQLSTPICLDESIVSARAAADAIAMGACQVVNIKPGRVGGYLEAKRIHDVCAAHDVPVWCGGMLETGLGRAANVALAALPNFVLPGDTSASDRYYRTDLTPPFRLEDGHLAVPTGPGLGVSPIPEVLEEVTTTTVWLPLP
ncbi:o-succinylbenzoate synthase [Nonomuraea sp. NPDC050310]|uniref:o-succinylbenzoate synthase n=1 Tax=Nonomuraea sp. NPDC050310 TaxID=3154935 RepID=UPI0033E489E0